MPEFKVNPPALQSMVRKTFAWTIGGFAIVMVIIYCLIIYTSWSGNETAFWTQVAIFPIAGGILLFLQGKRMKKAMAPTESLTIILTDTMVIREMDGVQMLGIYHQDIQSVSKTKKGHFVIRGKTSKDIIYAPNYLENLSGLETALQAIHPIDGGAPVKTMQTNVLAIMALLLLSMLGTLFLSEPWMAIICAVVFNGVGLWGIYWTWTNKNTPEKTRKNIWWTLVPMLIITLNMITRTWIK